MKYAASIYEDQPSILPGLLAVFAISFRDFRILQLGMAGWQVIIAAILMGMAFFGNRLSPWIKKFMMIWVALGIYTAIWFFVGFFQTNHIWPGAMFDIILGLSLLAYGASLDRRTRRRWLVFVITGYLLSNMIVGAGELIAGTDAFEWLHQTVYNANGRIRMLSAEPSNIYAPFLVGMGLLTALNKKIDLLLLLLSMFFLYESASKAFPFVALAALLLAWVLTSNLQQRLLRIALLVVSVFAGLALIIFIEPGLVERLVATDSPAAILLRANSNIIDYLWGISKSDQGSFATRTVLFVHTISIISSNPLFGVGPAALSESILSMAQTSGLITPEIIEYSYHDQKLITPKTTAMILLADYGIPFVLAFAFTAFRVIRRNTPTAIAFSVLVVLIASLATEGYNIWAWLALCMLVYSLDLPQTSLGSVEQGVSGPPSPAD